MNAPGLVWNDIRTVNPVLCLCVVFVASLHAPPTYTYAQYRKLLNPQVHTLASMCEVQPHFSIHEKQAMKWEMNFISHGIAPFIMCMKPSDKICIFSAEDRQQINSCPGIAGLPGPTLNLS